MLVGNRSTGLAEEASTRTSTPSSATLGRSISFNRRSPGLAGLSQTIALISVPVAVVIMTLLAQAERRVLVGDEGERVGVHSVGPADDSDDVVEKAAWVAASEQDHE